MVIDFTKIIEIQEKKRKQITKNYKRINENIEENISIMEKIDERSQIAEGGDRHLFFLYEKLQANRETYLELIEEQRKLYE